MIALSIRQPWADLIIHHGKDIENRTWKTSYRGPLLIHAAKAWGPTEKGIMLEHSESMDWDGGSYTPELGGIIGMVTMVDCVTDSESEWFDGPYGFVFEDPVDLSFKPFRGRQGLFKVLFGVAFPS